MITLHGSGVLGALNMVVAEPAFSGRYDWRGIYPDLPGHGRTQLPGAIRNHDDLVQSILAFIDAVARGERFSIAGWS